MTAFFFMSDILSDAPLVLRPDDFLELELKPCGEMVFKPESRREGNGWVVASWPRSLRNGENDSR